MPKVSLPTELTQLMVFAAGNGYTVEAHSWIAAAAVGSESAAKLLAARKVEASLTLPEVSEPSVKAYLREHGFEALPQDELGPSWAFRSSDGLLLKVDFIDYPVELEGTTEPLSGTRLPIRVTTLSELVESGTFLPDVYAEVEATDVRRRFDVGLGEEYEDDVDFEAHMAETTTAIDVMNTNFELNALLEQRRAGIAVEPTTLF